MTVVHQTSGREGKTLEADHGQCDRWDGHDDNDGNQDDSADNDKKNNVKLIWNQLNMKRSETNAKAI